MACGIVDVNQSAGDCGSDGGVSESRGVACEHIADVQFDAEGQITGFTMATAGQWGKLVYDDDDTAFYNQEPNRQGKKITFNQQSFMKFEQITNDKIQAACQATDCCCTVWVHKLNSGIVLTQGIDYDLDEGVWQFSKTNARVDAGVFSDTGDNADRVEYTINSVGRKPSPATILTLDAIDAL